MSRMMAMGVLCKLDAALVEYHSEQNPLWRSLMLAAGNVPYRFEKAIKYMTRHAGRGCKVVTDPLSASAIGSRR